MLRKVYILLPFLLLSLGKAQPLAPPYKVAFEELLTSHSLGRAQIRSGDLNSVVSLKVIVSAKGAVESVHILDGPKSVRKEAEAAERLLRFQPFLRDSKAVRATFQDTVSIYPEERWGDQHPFPEIRNWKTTNITLERRQWCDQPRCLAYRLEITGDGIVQFTRTKWASSNPTRCDGSTLDDLLR